MWAESGWRVGSVGGEHRTSWWMEVAGGGGSEGGLKEAEAVEEDRGRWTGGRDELPRRKERGREVGLGLRGFGTEQPPECSSPSLCPLMPSGGVSEGESAAPPPELGTLAPGLDSPPGS